MLAANSPNSAADGAPPTVIIPLLAVAGVSSKSILVHVSAVDVPCAPTLTKLIFNNAPEVEIGMPVPIWPEICKVPETGEVVKTLHPLVKVVVLTAGFWRPTTAGLKVKVRSNEIKAGGVTVTLMGRLKFVAVDATLAFGRDTVTAVGEVGCLPSAGGG